MTIPKMSDLRSWSRIMEKPRRTQGRKGAVKLKNPMKLIRVNGFLLDHKYTNMKVSEEPRNGKDAKGATRSIIQAPIITIQRKSAGLPANVSCSREREYRVRKNMWKKKSSPNL